MFVSSDSTSCQEFASQFGLAIVLYAKTQTKPRGNRVASACVYLNEAAGPVKGGVTPSWLGAHRPIGP